MNRVQALPVDRETKKSRRKSLYSSTAGNVLEWYEWSAYAAFAPFIAGAMFDKSDPLSALLSTLAVFAVGFLMRPLGGVVFGRIADRKGRKFVLICTILMMAIGGIVIGIMPTYDTIGASASVLLLAVRMIQGFAHGGESATAYSYVSEIAPANRRGMWGSLVFAAIFGGSVLAYTVGGVLTATLSEAAIAEWAWRVPFLLGTVLALYALYMRRGMEETIVIDSDSHRPKPKPIPRRIVTRAVLLTIGLTAAIAAAHYTWTSYISTYAITQKGMDPNTAYWTSVAAQIIALISLPFWGLLSDRIGRKPMFVSFSVLIIILQFPLTTMISDNGWTLFLAMGTALLVVAMPASVLSATMSEVFPTRIRAQAIGFSYSMSVAVFGGTAPYLNQFLTGRGIGQVFSMYVIALGVVTGITVLFMKETKGMELEA